MSKHNDSNTKNVSRLKKPTRTLVILPEFRSDLMWGESPAAGHCKSGRIDEAKGLCQAISLSVVDAVVIRRDKPHPAYLIGRGKIEELADRCREEHIGLVVFDHNVSPVQQRNLEKSLKTKILDRTNLILEIFGARARTKEGRLQVEMAHLQWQKSRLVRSWTHLERQRGGIGFMGGPGETQIETDRRLIQERIKRLERDLTSVRRARKSQRAQRKKLPLPAIALVGYTNAGKTTLFNQLTGAEVFAGDMLFATLDPTVRQIELSPGHGAALSDSVGFIKNLPTFLVASFRATLEELVNADIILHVRDILNPDFKIQGEEVEKTIDFLFDKEGIYPEIIEVWNKIDGLEDEQREDLLAANFDQSRDRIYVSAASGAGMDALKGKLRSRLFGNRPTLELTIPYEDGALLSWLYHICEILSRSDAPGGIALKIRAPHQHFDRVRERCGAYLASR